MENLSCLPSEVAVFSNVLLMDAGEYGTPSAFSADNIRAAYDTHTHTHMLLGTEDILSQIKAEATMM